MRISVGRLHNIENFYRKRHAIARKRAQERREEEKMGKEVEYMFLLYEN